jgi:hypothetical protein
MFPLPGLIQNSHFRSYRNPIKKLKTDPTKSEKKKYIQTKPIIYNKRNSSFLPFVSLHLCNP